MIQRILMVIMMLGGLQASASCDDGKLGFFCERLESIFVVTQYANDSDDGLLMCLAHTVADLKNDQKACEEKAYSLNHPAPPPPPRCYGEAQITAKVAEIRKRGMSSCKVYVKNISFFAENGTCPLDLNEILENGIEIGMTNGHDCEYNSDAVSGVVVKNAAGVLRLE